MPDSRAIARTSRATARSANRCRNPLSGSPGRASASPIRRASRAAVGVGADASAGDVEGQLDRRPGEVEVRALEDPELDQGRHAGTLPKPHAARAVRQPHSSGGGMWLQPPHRTATPRRRCPSHIPGPAECGQSSPHATAGGGGGRRVRAVRTVTPRWVRSRDPARRSRPPAARRTPVGPGCAADGSAPCVTCT